MKLLFRIAWRYFWTKKSVQAVNIISWISMGAIAVAAAAMIILFSVFNGLDHTIKQMYTAFNPSVKITPVKGKFFVLTPTQKKELTNIPGVQMLSETIEDMALLSNESEQRAAVVKGVDNNWFQVADVDSFMIAGKSGWRDISAQNIPVILGMAIANNLSIDVNNPFSELNIYYPKPDIGMTLNPEKALSAILTRPQGLFHVQRDLDERYVLIPLVVAQQFLGQQGKLSAVDIKARAPSQVESIQRAASRIMGAGFTIANRYEQNQTLFMVLSGEKWMVYAILLFVLLIASFNLTGCLYMLVLEKKRDIAILKSMGTGNEQVRFVFLIEGLLLSGLGAVIGVVLGSLICLGQIYFGWISLPDGFVITAYPVALEWADFVLVLGTAFVIGLLAAWYPAFKAGKQAVFLREE